MAKKKILITGGAGFIGSSIAEYWSGQGADVTVLDSLRTGHKKNIEHLNVKFVCNSVTNRSLVEQLADGADTLYHLASMVSVPESFVNPRECYEINTMGLINLIDACVKQKQTKIIYSSSASVYGNNSNLPLKSDERTEPLSPYGAAKLTGEHVLKTMKTEMGIRAVAFRYFNVYGPRQDPKGAYASVIPLFISRALRNDDIIIFGDGSAMRDFVSVRDVVQANVLAADKDTQGDVFNVASGRTCTVKELAEMVVKLTGSKSKIRFEAPRRGDILLSEADISNTREELGYEPSTALEEGLQATIDYFRQAE